MDALCEIGGGNGGAVRHTAHVRFRYGPFISICMCSVHDAVLYNAVAVTAPPPPHKIYYY